MGHEIGMKVRRFRGKKIWVQENLADWEMRSRKLVIGSQIALGVSRIGGLANLKTDNR